MRSYERFKCALNTFRRYLTPFDPVNGRLSGLRPDNSAPLPWTYYVIDEETGTIAIDEKTGKWRTEPSEHRPFLDFLMKSMIIRLNVIIETFCADLLRDTLFFTKRSPLNFTVAQQEWLNTINNFGVSPTFDKIYAAFEGLFPTTKREQLAEVFESIAVDQYFTAKISFRCHDTIEFRYQSLEAVSMCCRLFYAMRCLFSHGSSDRTLITQLYEGMRFDGQFSNQQACKFFTQLCNDLLTKKANISLDYRVVMIYLRFVNNFAWMLHRAIRSVFLC